MFKGNNTRGSKVARGRLFVLWFCGMMTVSIIFLSTQQMSLQESDPDADLDLPTLAKNIQLSSHERRGSVETGDADGRMYKKAKQSLRDPIEELQEKFRLEQSGKIQKEQEISSKNLKDKKKNQKDTAELSVKKPKKPRPPLASLIKDTERGVTGHVSFLLDWAIIGHAKAATSFIMKWLDRHPEVATWGKEVCDLYDNRPANLVKRLYEELPEGKYKRGFKCPGHFSRRSIRYFKKYFSKTRVIVGVRHPVRWFESFYNFRMRHGGANYTLPPPNKLIGECTPETDGICTDRANFHTNLAVFGKTNLLDPSEQNLVRFRKYTYESTYRIDNPLFLYDVAQFYDENTTRTELFKTDLQHFLGLKAPMPEPDSKDAGKSSKQKPKAMDICSKEFDEVRKELVLIGKRASMWIRKYLLKSDSVFVSSREHFETVLKEWKEDPCEKALSDEGDSVATKM